MDRSDKIMIIGVTSMIISSLLPRFVAVTNTTALIVLLLTIVGFMSFIYAIIIIREQKKVLKKEIGDLEAIIKASMKSGLR